MKKTFIFLIFILLFTSCNVAEIAGIGKSDLGDNFSKQFDGLIHYYKFDSGSAGSTRFDSAGSVNLTDYTSTSGNTGVYGNSIDCSTATTPGTSGVLTAQGISEGISSTGSYTVSFWIYMNTIAIGGIFAYGPMEIAITATGAIQATLDGSLRTKQAILGIRGTDYLVKVTSLLGETEIIVFDGKVNFASQIDNKDQKEISKNQWGGLGGRFGKNIGQVLDLPKNVIDYFDSIIPNT